MKTVELTRGNMRFAFDAPAGTYSVETSKFKLEKVSPTWYLDGKKTAFGAWKIVKETKYGLTAEAQGKSGLWRLTAALDAKETLTLALTGKLDRPCENIQVWYFEDASLPADHLATQGHCMGGCELYPLTGKGVKPEQFTAATQILATRKGTQLRISFPLRGEHLETIGGDTAKGAVEHFRAGFDIRHITQKRLALKPLSFREGDGFAMMYAYADENTTEKRDLKPFAVPGWNSWDYYRWTVTEDEVMENAEFIAHDPVLSKYVKKIIVDDGWQYAYGEWEANSLFPHGMEWLAKNIRKLGFKPGLWIAPTVIEPHSWIAQMEPEMLGKAENGQPTLCFNCMKRNAFILDPTVKKSQKFIYDLFDKYATRGYEYFKLDFLGATRNARQFTDKNIGRGHLMELTIGIARQAVQGRATLLGCNYLFNGGQQWVDLVRVGGDIHARWDSIKGNTPSVAMLFWANKKLWVNDPDFALCRGFDTSDDPMLTQMRCSTVFVRPEETDPDFIGGKFTLVDMRRTQAEVLLSIVLCAGGAVNLSDKMTRLNESGLDLARRTVAAESGEAALPLDLFSTKLPCYWVQKIQSGHRVLLVNWEDTPAIRRLDLARANVPGRSCTNFWNDAPVAVKNGVIEVELAPRSCLFAVVK